MKAYKEPSSAMELSAQLSREIRSYLLSAPQSLTVYRGTHLIKTDPYYNRIPTPGAVPPPISSDGIFKKTERRE